ncbi:MAG: DAPG hydrolase family protein [Lachnospiraceae bacterium]
MNKITTYIANGGQTYLPFKDNIMIDFVPYEKPEKPSPLLPNLELTSSFVENGFVLPSQKQHFLPNLTSEMLDWFWANMEKCYYLWAPGSHKRFSWVKEPWKYGMMNSVHMISEVVEPGKAIFGGNGVEIRRLPLEKYFPFTTSLKHVICEGVFNAKNEWLDSTIHMWEDVEGGVVHITATIQNTRATAPPDFIIEMLQENPKIEIVPNYETDHEDYEASQWPIFLPKLYDLWKNHPDPTQNVSCSLEVTKNKFGEYRYITPHQPIQY